MDFLDFLARSEWPAVVSGGLYAFRKELRHILQNIHLKKLKVGEEEAEFEQDIENAERLSKNLSANMSSNSETKATLTVTEAPDSLNAVGYISSDAQVFHPAFVPSVQVTSAWITLLAHMKSLYDQDGDGHGPRRLKWREPGPLQDLAAELGLTPSEVGAFTEMEALNHRITTSPSPFVTRQEAKRYRAVINRLQNKMKLPQSG